MRTSVVRRATAAFSMVLLAALAGVPAAAPAAAKITPCTNPPPIFPIGNVKNGQSATGWTVLQGTTPESFDVTLLGVLPDAIAPGKDLIMVKASGANIDAIGGMGPGFSGSPVYRNGALVGSVSYGLGGDAHYGALTPGQDLLDVMMEPSARSVASRQHVHLTRAQRVVIARSARVQVADVSSSLEQIPMPLAVSGATNDRIKQVTKKFTAAGTSVIPYRASSLSSSAKVNTTDPIEPGDVFAAAISYGSLTYAGVGTATISCGDYVVAFGHSFFHSGGGPSGAVLDGEVVTTVPGGNGYFPFKLANVGVLQGTLEQDRLSGVRGLIGRMPTLARVDSTITNLDTGAVDNATTQVARKSWVASIGADHVYYAIHAALDAHRGTTWAHFTIVISSHGQQYTVEFGNAYIGGRALYGPANDIYGALRSIDRADGAARIVSVHADLQVSEHRTTYVIHRARTASTTSPSWQARDAIDVKAGDTLSVRVPLQAPDTGDVHVAATTFTIPATATRDGFLEVSPARPNYWYRNLSLEETIAKLTSQPRYTDLQLEVRMRGAHRLIQIIPQDRPLTNYSEVELNLVRR